MSTPRQGEIWWAEAEHERRPVLVVTRSEAVPVLSGIVVAPITRTVRRISTEMGSVLAHLHGRGIAHGDLYAHNILVDGEGHALLSDFGAASHPRCLAPHQQDGFRRIEARAYGCLLDDLLGLTAMEPGLDDLATLRDKCLSDTPADRPSTADLGMIAAAKGS